MAWNKQTDNGFPNYFPFSKPLILFNLINEILIDRATTQPTQPSRSMTED